MRNEKAVATLCGIAWKDEAAIQPKEVSLKKQKTLLAAAHEKLVLGRSRKSAGCSRSQYEALKVAQERLIKLNRKTSF